MRLSFECFGRRIGIESEAEIDLDLYLPPERRATPFSDIRRRYRIEQRPDGEWQATCGQRLVATSRECLDVCEDLEGDIALYLAETSPTHVFVHAGVVEWEGRAIVVPGRSFAGKSRLVAALLAAGARYMSDEFAAIDAGGMVHPYRRPLKLRVPGARHPRREIVTSTRADAAPLGLVAGLRYESCWNVRELSWGEAMLLLLDNAVGIRAQPARVLPALRRALTGTRTLAGTRGDAEEAASYLLTDAFARRDPRVLLLTER